jgi:hypothetical protein
MIKSQGQLCGRVASTRRRAWSGLAVAAGTARWYAGTICYQAFTESRLGVQVYLFLHHGQQQQVCMLS